MSQNLRNRLDEQIRRMKRACANYDSGDFEASLDLAVAMRVLFYDTGKSTSLCHQLGIKDQLAFPSFQGLGMTKPVQERMRRDGTWTVSFNMEFVPGEQVPRPITGPSRYRNSPILPLKDWFAEVVHCSNEILDRKELMLCVCHKLGGAHVEDATADALDLQLGAGSWTTTLPSGDVVKTELSDQHLPLMRSMGAEVLFLPWWEE